MTWYVVDKKEYVAAYPAIGAAYRDIIGRHFKQPEEGLGYDNSPSSHMWRSIIRPAKFL